MSTRIGVDIGGTFTDLIFYDDVEKSISIAKVPTTPSSPEVGCGNAVSSSLTAAHIAQAEYFLHGTTVGLNALLERKGSTVGLLCTRQFRDVMEIRRGARSQMYNLFWQPPEPLVPRRLRLPVTERVNASGDVLVDVVEDDVLQALDTFKAHGVDAIAICFLNAYANGAHERQTADILRRAGFEGVISCSHVVSGEYREYERTSTTIVDAFVQGRMSNYLARLTENLTDAGFSGEALITRSGGGAMSFAEASSRSFETVMSGPVAGAEGAAELVRKFDLGDVITADVGGTSFDACVVKDGRPILLYEGEIAGFPLQAPWVDVRSIGAGGGSIAYVDAGGRLRVGPQSAGSEPGPACYRRGGSAPCLTDAFLALGMLGAGKFANGMSLDFELANQAIGSVASPLGKTAQETAIGIVRIAGSFMANTIREITIEQGRDPREMTLLPFGGAGPVMGTLLADELDIRRILVPAYAGNFSAWGLLGADLIKAKSQTKILPLTDAGVSEASAILRGLFHELNVQTAPSDGDGDGAEQGGGTHYQPEARIDMRYVGQEHVLSVPVPLNALSISISAEALKDLFVQEYFEAYGVTLEHEAVEMVVCRATLRHPLPDRKTRGAMAPGGADGAKPLETLEAYSFNLQRKCAFALRSLAEFQIGESVGSGVILSDSTTTIYIDHGYEGVVHESGGVMLTKTQ